jgi:phospholipid/cholesterol/gamma-HCH transport system substrate-binding protein
MNGRGSMREVLVGLVVVVTLLGLLVLCGLAGGGPGFLSSRRSIDVVFRDGQGIREGCPVRVAGLDAGRVDDVDLVEDKVDGTLRARVRISLPTALAGKLRQDAKVTIQSSLAGQSRVNIVSSGHSKVALVPGQIVQGVESTFFDPILEQVGLGPVERSHLSHTIAEVRQTVDAVGPRLRLILGALQETATGLRESSDTIRPVVEATAVHIEELSRRVNASTPRIEAALARVDTLTQQADGILAENRPNLQATLAIVHDMTASLNDIIAKDRGKVERLLDGLDGTRQRADRALYRADQIGDEAIQLLARNRVNIDRTVTNIRDATDWADKLVQKIFANPFVLSPLYRPTPEDIRAQAVYDQAQIFTKGAQELADAIKNLDAMQARATTPKEQQDIDQARQKINALFLQLNQTAQLLAESLKPQPQGGRGLRR